jgi:hypothetical protein
MAYRVEQAVESTLFTGEPPPKFPFLACEVAILGDFEIMRFPQNWGLGGEKDGNAVEFALFIQHRLLLRGEVI